MKKKIKLLLMMFMLSLVVLSNNIFASTKTYDRESADNYGVPSSIVVGNSNKSIVLKTPLVDASEKVYDFADLLTDEQEKKLYEGIQVFIEEYNMDMVIVTIDSNNKRSQVEYADDFYDYNKFGVGATRDGILFLIDMDNRQMHISTTGEAIRMYNDYRIDKILDDTYYYIKSQDYYNCSVAFIKKASSYAKDGIPSGNKNSYIGENGNIYYKDGQDNGEVILTSVIAGFVISLIATAIFSAIASGKHKVIRKATQARAYLKDETFELSDKIDQFRGSHTSKVYDPPSSSSSGGGSSTHSSSSGSSHGGGSRGF